LGATYPAPFVGHCVVLPQVTVKRTKRSESTKEIKLAI
jgi:hypothetical protein